MHPFSQADIARHLSKVVVPVLAPTNSIGEFHFFLITIIEIMSFTV